MAMDDRIREKCSRKLWPSFMIATTVFCLCSVLAYNIIPIATIPRAAALQINNLSVSTISSASINGPTRPDPTAIKWDLVLSVRNPNRRKPINFQYLEIEMNCTQNTFGRSAVNPQGFTVRPKTTTLLNETVEIPASMIHACPTMVLDPWILLEFDVHLNPKYKGNVRWYIYDKYSCKGLDAALIISSNVSSVQQPKIMRGINESCPHATPYDLEQDQLMFCSFLLVFMLLFGAMAVVRYF